MSDGQPILVFFILLLVLFIAVIVAIVRWLFRINEIAGYLKRLADRLAPIMVPRPPAPKEYADCDCCHKEFEISELVELERGKMVCPPCNRLLSSIQRES